MKGFILNTVFISFFLSAISICFSQQSKIDSLLYLLKKDKPDTNKVIHLYQLTRECELIGDFDNGLNYGKDAIELAVKLNFKKGIMRSYINAGNIYNAQGNYPKTLNYFLEALKLGEELNDKNAISMCFGNIGITYYRQADYPKALDYYFNALKTAEGLESKNLIAYWLGNIGNVYWSQKEYPKALDYYFKTLKIEEEVGNKNRIAAWFGNIGIVYYSQADYPKALDYYFKALKIQEEIGNKNGIATNLGNIGIVYADVFKSQKSEIGRDSLFNKALDYFSKALKMKEELGNKNGIASTLANLGSLYTDAKKYTEAEKYLLKALKIDKEIGAQNGERETEESLTELYTKTNRYQLALEHYKKAMELKDTLFNAEKNKEITRKEMNFEFDKKESLAKADQDKKDAISKGELKQKEQQRNYFIIGFALVGLLALFIFRGYRQKQKANVIITQQKSEVEKSKHIIEEKNKDITDSINYAKRIQRAMLPHRRDIWAAFPQSFVLYKPKDIVSGDFYFFHPAPTLPKGQPKVASEAPAHTLASPPLGETGEGVAFIAVADCTGHGVPGAFMSMIGAGKLNDAVSASANTSEILSLLNKGVKSALKQSETDETATRDGMDIALVGVDLQGFKNLEGLATLHYAGANRPIWIIRKGATAVEEIKATKKAIGGFTENDQHFDTHEIQLQEGDTFYLSTDGYADTFGKDGKKMMTKRFKDTLLSIQDKTMKEQEKYLDDFVENWKAGTEQVDDILVIGVRL